MIPRCRDAGIATVEMQAAALYALATAMDYPIVCFAYVTNTMAVAGDDFKEGLDQGSHAILAVIAETIRCWDATRDDSHR